MSSADTDDARLVVLEENLVTTTERIAVAKAAAGRTDHVALMVVTKFHPLDDVVRLARLGVREFGENRAQEAKTKFSTCVEGYPDVASDIRWNFIGQIQSKKAPSIGSWVDRVHSVDSMKVADGLDKGRGRARRQNIHLDPLPVLLQVSLDRNLERGGVAPEQLGALADYVATLEHVRLAGIMVVPPLAGEPARHFAHAHEIRCVLMRNHPDATEFSAGMSHDLEDAIQAGSTLVRVGTAILGTRPLG